MSERRRFERDLGTLWVLERVVARHKVPDAGIPVSIPFQNAKVGMPILSIAKLSNAHDSWFGKSGGELIHRKTEARIPFVKRAGVYFMKLRFRKSVAIGKSYESFQRSGK